MKKGVGIPGTYKQIFHFFTQAEKLTKEVSSWKLFGLSNWTSLFYQGIVSESTLK